MNKISLLFVTFIGLVSVGLSKNSTNFDTVFLLSLYKFSTFDFRLSF